MATTIKGYTRIEETSSEHDRNKLMMTLAQQELMSDANKMRLRIVTGEIKDLKRSGKFSHISEYGATKIAFKGRLYYLYPNMLAEVRKGDNTLRIVYMVGQNKDTIKLAREKCRALGLINSKRNIVDVYLDSMNLQGK